VRPYHQIAKKSIPCQHDIIAGLSSRDAKLLAILGECPDAVVFMDAPTETYRNLRVKDIGMQEEYYCNLGNSPVFVCQGQASLLADAFYNEKPSHIYPDYNDVEAIINSKLSVRLQLGQIKTYLAYIALPDNIVKPTYHSSIEYLHEKINKLL
jgi:hypothetical protein